MSERIVLGVDIGGTKVAAGLVDPGGQVLCSTRFPMTSPGSGAAAMACVHRAIEGAMEAANGLSVSAIGVVSPGPLDVRTGVVLHTPNLPGWRNFELRAEIERTYGKPTRLDNDANAAGLAEALWGAGHEYRHVLYVTIGTGIGTAIILDRSIYHGRTGAAAEGGHMAIDYRGAVRCGCGKRGCLEGMASGPAIAAAAREKAAADPERGRTLLARAGDGPESITAETVVNAWRSGNALATEVIEGMIELLAVWFGNMIDVLEPDVIVIGGGVGTHITEAFPILQQRLSAWSINTRAHEIPMVAARFGVDAGLVGSAALWFDEAAQPG
ncbi:MAG: ROK family protein [Terriglobales bacterium]